MLARQRPQTDLEDVELAARERPDRDLDRQELADALAAALDRLTGEQREAFVLKHVDGRSYEEMESLLGVGVDALKMRVHRARDTLRTLMGETR
jgi:RNA polymerase sigma-70 factor (ECF subfamily)